MLSAQSQLLQATFALDLYKLRDDLSLLDSVVAFSSELLKVHSDNFTEYSLTLGKQSQGLVQFRNNMIALTDHSKMLNASAPKDADRQLAADIQLTETFQAHGTLHERVISLSSQLSQDLNSDFPALFNEKKYKELQAIAAKAQPALVQQTQT